MEGRVEVYCGQGKGKTSCAIGHCIKAAGQAKQVIIVQFLKGKDTEEIDFIRRLEPEVQLFRFEKYEKQYKDLSEEEKKEQDHYIFNGLKNEKKVIDTRQCDVLILDEVLGLLDLKIIEPSNLIDLLKERSEELDVIMTGRSLPEELMDYVDAVYCIETMKES